MSAIRPIDPTPALAPTAGVERPGAARVASEGGFAATLADAVDQARASERAAVSLATGFADGDPGVGIHEVMIASEKANLSLRYATTLKNKMLDAYRELMSTQV